MAANETRSVTEVPRWGAPRLAMALLVALVAHCNARASGSDPDQRVRCERGGVRCVCEAPQGSTYCNGYCVFTATSMYHCGGCERWCMPGSSCVNGRCVCHSGLVCAGQCVDAMTNPEHCGGCGRACGPSQRCRGGQCACEQETQTACGARCVDLRSDGANCGACGTRCSSEATCRQGWCQPRPVAPMSGARVGQGPLTFRWSIGGARVEVCADRACTRVVRALTASEPAARLSESLGAGVYFWRLRSMDGAHASERVWSFRVDARRAPRGGLLPPDFDLDGDGLADVVATTRRGTRVAVYFGARTGLAAVPDVEVVPSQMGRAHRRLAHRGDAQGDGTQWLQVGYTELEYVQVGWPRGRAEAPMVQHFSSAPAGAVFDVNGDGYQDELGAMSAMGSMGLGVSYGPLTGPRLPPTFLLEDPTPSRLSVAGVGDVDGDGFSDALVGVPTSAPPRAWVYFGGRAGLGRSQPLLPLVPVEGTGETVAPAGDVNGDGYADLLVRVRRQGAYVHFGGATVTLHRSLMSANGDDLVVSRAGDVNGDGYGDLLAVPPSRREAWLYLGSAAGLPDAPVVLRDATWSDCDGAVAAPGDIDGDDFDDVFIGVPSANEVRVFFGAATAPLTRGQTLRGGAHSELGLHVLW